MFCQKSILSSIYVFQSISELVSDSDPSVSKIVSASKNLEVVPIRNEGLYVLVDFGGFLALSSSLAPYDIAASIFIEMGVAFHANEADFLCMLEVEPMSLCDLSVDRCLDPGYLVDDFVSPSVFHHVDCKRKLVIDHPDKEESVLL